MSDAEYAAKYGQDTSRVSLKRKVKQAIDARHLAYKGGWHVGAGGQSDPTNVGAEVGLFSYTEPWLEFRTSLAALTNDDVDTGYGGANVGVRLQSPSRFAPFVGVGGFGGFSAQTYGAIVLATLDEDEDDCDCDCYRCDDEDDEEYRLVEEDHTVAFAAVYPEIGFHYWITPRIRLTASGSYHFTTLGRDDDYWYYGIGVGILFGPEDREEVIVVEPAGSLTSTYE